jgi:hypothetical protein
MAELAGRHASGVNGATEAGRPADGRSPLSERLVEGPDGRSHRLQVNLGESPAGWLFARKMLTRRQFEAAEAIRGDWERAGMGARVTMDWNIARAPARRRGGGGAPERTLAGIAARERLHGALRAAGPGLSDILWRVVCACEGLGAAEQSLGWPVRAGKLVLGFALDRVADYYRIG